MKSRDPLTEAQMQNRRNQLQRWIDHDENAPLKVSMVIVQLQRLVNALRDIAHAEQWPIELE